ncbi:MAG: hypothetical protein K1X94_30840, partial [Sandaracinaceae bacterium]|nr:hypothetical protein [Sandaracinaceae bacterium]
MFHPESAPEAALHRAEPEERPRLGLPVAPERLLSAIRRAKRSVAIAALAGSVVGIAAAKTVAPRQFRATGTFAYEAPGGSTGDEARRLETITSSVKLPSVLSEARARLGGKSGIDELGKKIEVGTAEQSNLFTISASAGAPDEAKELTDAIIAAFLEAQTALAEKRAKETLDLKRKETSAAKRRAEAARKAWDEFRKEHGVADPSAEAAAALSEIARLQTEGKLAAVDATAEVAREKVLREVLKKLPATMVLAARESRPALVRLAELQAEKKRLEGHLTPDHPKLGALAAEIESLSSLA